MDVVDWTKYIYKKLEEQEKMISDALARGAVKDCATLFLFPRYGTRKG